MGLDAPAMENPSEWTVRGNKMAKDAEKNSYRRFILFVAGFFILVLGVTLILIWWKDLVVIFRGALGLILALAGLFMMYAINKTK